MAGGAVNDRNLATRPATVITGSSVGIGFAIALRSVEAGENVVIIARGAERLAAAAARLADTAVPGQVIVPLALDVTVPDAPAIIDAALADAGLHLDVLVNNAGVGFGGTFASEPDNDVEALLALNVSALTRLTRHALAGMLARRSGTIINVSSLGGFTPGPYQAAYYASKAYVNSLTEAVGWETLGSGVAVILVAPGPVDTDFHAAMRAERALYRRLLPAMSPHSVARWVHWGRRLGFRVIVPGLLYRFVSLAVRVIPHPLSLPLLGILLKPRRPPR